MSYDWSFELDEDVSPLFLATTIAQECGLAVENDGKHPAIIGKGIVGFALTQSALGKQIVHDAFGINTINSLVCSVDRNDPLGMSMDSITLLCVRMLQRFSCDLVLVGNGEKPYVLRKSGQVFVDRQPDAPQYSPRWWESKLAAANIAFEACALPML